MNGRNEVSDTIHYCRVVLQQGSGSAAGHMSVRGYLEIFVRDVPEEVRSQFLSLGAATKGGLFTITIPVTRETLPDAQKAWAIALQRVLA
jgi:hypothetical protein